MNGKYFEPLKELGPQESAAAVSEIDEGRNDWASQLVRSQNSEGLT
jgi:hypothetical protein